MNKLTLFVAAFAHLLTVSHQFVNEVNGRACKEAQACGMAKARTNGSLKLCTCPEGTSCEQQGVSKKPFGLMYCGEQKSTPICKRGQLAGISKGYDSRKFCRCEEPLAVTSKHVDPYTDTERYFCTSPLPRCLQDSHACRVRLRLESPDHRSSHLRDVCRCSENDTCETNSSYTMLRYNQDDRQYLDVFMCKLRQQVSPLTEC